MVWRHLHTGDGHIDKKVETKIVFGPVSNPETVLAQSLQESDEQDEGLYSQLSVLSKATPGLRLSTPGWIDITPRSLMGVDSTELLFELCMEKLRTRVQPFSQRIRLFVKCYFDFIAQQIETHSDLLGTDEIIKPDDWVFSSWLPLPHAQILLPGTNEGQNSSQNNQYAEVDIIFWTGHSLIGLQLEQTGFIAKSRRENLERLKLIYPDINLITIDHESWGEQSAGFPTHLFDDEFLQFWRDVDIPRGPALTSMSIGTDFNSNGPVTQ